MTKEFVIGKIYRLRLPSDGIGDNGIARYPIGLPVELMSIEPDSFVVKEPHGTIVYFPYRSVWNQKGNIFEMGLQKCGEYLLEEFKTQEEAKRVWKIYAEPEKYRWYVDDLRDKLKESVYSDWECGWQEGGIRHILEAARVMMGGISGKSIYSQETINAVCDIALLIFENDSPGWYEEISQEDNLTEIRYDSAQEAAYFVVSTILELMNHDYFVKSTGTWNLKEKKFIHDKFEVAL